MISKVLKSVLFNIFKIIKMCIMAKLVLLKNDMVSKTHFT